MDYVFQNGNQGLKQAIKEALANIITKLFVSRSGQAPSTNPNPSLPSIPLPANPSLPPIPLPANPTIQVQNQQTISQQGAIPRPPISDISY